MESTLTVSCRRLSVNAAIPDLLVGRVTMMFSPIAIVFLIIHEAQLVSRWSQHTRIA